MTSEPAPQDPPTVTKKVEETLLVIESVGRRIESGRLLQAAFVGPENAGSAPALVQTSSRDLAFAFFKHRWSVLAIVLTSMIGMLFWMYCVREESYDARAKILVRIGQEQTSSSIVSRSPILITGDRSQDVNSEVEILTSTDLLDPLVTYFKLDQPSAAKPVPQTPIARARYEVRRITKQARDWWAEQAVSLGLRERLTPRERAIANLRKMLLVSAERNSNIVSVHLITEQREDAGLLLNKLVESYEAFRLKLYAGQDTAGFFRGEMDKSAGDLRGSEQNLKRFENTWDISSIDTQKEVLLGEIASAQTAAKNMEIDYNDTAAKLARAEAESQSAEPDFAAIGAFEPQSFPAGLLQQMAELQKQREALRMTELDSGDRVRNNRNQFAVLLNLVTTNLRSALAQKRSQLEARRQILQNLEAKIRDLQGKETEWNALRRNEKIYEDNFLNYGKKLEEASASSTMEKKHIGNVAVVEHATDPVEPTGMPKTRLLALGFVLALFAAIAWIGIAEFLDHRVYTADVLEKRLQAPIFEVIPEAKRRGFAQGERELQWAADSFRRTAAMLANAAAGRKSCVFVSSAGQGGGTTTATLGVAEQLTSLYGYSTLVVELDHQRPVLVNRFKLDPDRTTEAFVAGRLTPGQCVQKNGASMSFLPAPVSKSGKPFTPAAFRDLLRDVQPQFDFVLVDTPSLLQSGSAFFSDAAGRLVLVVEAGKTSYEMLDRVRRELISSNVPIDGAILNKYREFIPRWASPWFVP